MFYSCFKNFINCLAVFLAVVRTFILNRCHIDKFQVNDSDKKFVKNLTDIVSFFFFLLKISKFSNISLSYQGKSSSNQDQTTSDCAKIPKFSEHLNSIQEEEIHSTAAHNQPDTSSLPGHFKLCRVPLEYSLWLNPNTKT